MSSVRFVTRAGCLLCAEAQPLVERVARRRGHAFEVVDVDRDGALAEFDERVPVVLLDGVEVLSGRFDRRAVRRALR
jgi:glutaredoxin